MTLSHSVNPNNHFFGGHHNYVRAPDMQGGSYHTLSAVHSPPASHTMHISNRCFVENPPNEWFSSGAHDHHHHHFHEVGSYYHHHVGPYNEAYGEYENGHSPKKTIGVTGTPIKKKTVNGTFKTPDTPWKGDWSCPQCEVCNFARNKHCRNCRTQKPEKKVKRNKPNNESKDWICQNCEDTMFAYRKVCRRCNTPRGEVPPELPILSPQLPPPDHHHHHQPISSSPQYPPAFESSKTSKLSTLMQIEENEKVEKRMPRKIKCNAVAEGEGAWVKKKIVEPNEPYFLDELSLGPQVGKKPPRPRPGDHHQDCSQSSEGSTCDTSSPGSEPPHTQLDTSDDEYGTHAQRCAEALEYTKESQSLRQFGASKEEERMGCRPAGHDAMVQVPKAESNNDEEAVRRSTSSHVNHSPDGGSIALEYARLGEPIRLVSTTNARNRGLLRPEEESHTGLFNIDKDLAYADDDNCDDDMLDPQLVASILRVLECFPAEVL